MRAAARTVDRTPKAQRTIFGEPARIMAPRLLLLITAFGLTVFGLVMIYSSSSITALYQMGDAAFYLKRQALFAAIGVAVAVALRFVDYHKLMGRRLYVAWGVMILLLVAVHTSIAGQDAYGASRWVAVGPVTIQPSEFAKPVAVLMGAWYLSRYYQDHELSDGGFWLRVCAFLGLLLVLIVLQPDKGTTGIIALTLLLMAYFSGLPSIAVGVVFALGGIVAAAYSMHDSYSRARIMTMFDPFLDASNTGYQLVQGFYAFGSGGLFGVGVGMSKQKYNYLPMAYNDFIFAVIGEELGFVGTVAVVAAIALLLWAGYRIAEQAPDLEGKLIAFGCATMFAIQFLLNVCGVLGLFPLSGKPVPFVSYGGSSIMACLIMVGLMWSVSVHSHLPQTVYDRRRSMLREVTDEDDAAWRAQAQDRYDEGLSRAGNPTPRSWRRTNLAGGSYGRRGGGAYDDSSYGNGRSRARAYDRRDERADEGVGRPSETRPRTLRLAGSDASRQRGRSDAYQRGRQRGGWDRIDLDADPADRLRKYDDTRDRDGRPRGRRS